MKKINKKIVIIIGFIIILLFLFLIFKDHKMKCTFELNQKNYSMNSKYIITYKNGIVKRVDIIEKVISKDNEVLDRFEKSWKKDYEYQEKMFGGYTYQIKKNKKEVLSSVTIDYKALNIKKFLRINGAMKDYVNSHNQVTIKGIRTMYEKSGFKCK